MRAYHNDPELKLAVLATLREHREADKLVQGYGYWLDGKGCAVGCLLHSDNHQEYEELWEIPQMLAHLEDRIFEGLPPAEAQAWPERFCGAITVGADLSRVGWQFLHWLLTDETVNPGINHPLVRDVVKRCADVLAPLAEGGTIDASAESAAYAAESAASAAWSAAYAARSAESSAEDAAWSAESAASAAWSAAYAAWSAAYAAWSAAYAARSAESSAESAAYAAESAASAAWSAARSAERSAASAARSAASAAWSAASSAEDAAGAAAYVRMADKLVELLEAAT